MAFPQNEKQTIELFRFLEPWIRWRIVHLQTRFPDAIIEHQNGPRLIVEFEHSSINYKIHDHPTEGCDLIVCFRNNWPDAPLPVWALEEIIMPERKNVSQLERQLQKAHKDIWSLDCKVVDLERAVHALQDTINARESEILKTVLNGWQKLIVHSKNGKISREVLIPFPIPDWCSLLAREYLIYEKMRLERGQKW